jgi:hypothetical protein
MTLSATLGPQGAGSCWYYLRYLDPDNEVAFDREEKES